MTAASRTPPIIDITPLRSSTDLTDRGARACVNAIHAACLDSGFFVAIGHGLDDEISEAFEASRSFFALPQEQKERTPRLNRFGFVPQAELALDSARQHGRTEFLDLGLDDEVALPALAGFESVVRSYQRKAQEQGATILGALAVALGLDRRFFADRMTNPQCKLRFLHYRKAAPGSDGALPVATEPHTDYGAITMLATDGVPGLEVKPIGADWIPVVAPAGALIINLGDMLARWSNDRYRSTPHRVVGPVAGERYSIPFFLNPDPATIVECIPTCVTPERPCRYEPVSAGEFLAARIDNITEPYVDRHEGPIRHVPSSRKGAR